MAEAYSNFAAVYDALMDNIPYDAWADYLHGLHPSQRRPFQVVSRILSKCQLIV